MKLRARKKSVLNNIKKEDCKPSTLTNARLPNATATSTNTFDITIKQEVTKEQKNLSKQEGDLGKEEYRYQCDLCDMKMINLSSVLEHRTLTHGIRQLLKRVKNVDVEPDVHDLDFYCKSCKRGYSNTHLYRHHLRLVHYMILEPMSNLKTPKYNIDPNPNDPNLYCKACNFTYKHKNNYRRHCRYAHGSKLANSNRTATTCNLTDSYCHICDKRFSSISSYRAHIFSIHKIDSRPIQQKRDDILPNVNDPNFYCRSCEKKLASKDSFRVHLMTVHSIIFKSAPKNSGLKPNVDDPNNYCRACQKTYISKGRYREHLRIVHQMTLTPLRGNVDREHLPDPYNPNCYCSVCKKTYASLTLYRKHCKAVHFMELPHYSITNPNATIDINDPGFHCAQCERFFLGKYSFKKHLRRAHNL